MIPASLGHAVILIIGILHPGYESFKTMRTKSVDNYINWMVYWIVFSGFCGLEYITDIFLRWFPLYSEIKLILLFWLLPSQNNGSAVIYRKFLYPFLARRECQIDEFLDRIRCQGYDVFMTVVRHCIVCTYHYVTELVQRNWPISLLPPSRTQLLALPSADMIESILTRPLTITQLPQKSEYAWQQVEKDNDDNDEDIDYDLDALFYHDSNMSTNYSQSSRNKRVRDASVGSISSLKSPKAPLTTQTFRRAHSSASRS